MKFCEFFAGVGLVREGLRSTGWQCVWANDICNSKRETYVKNFGDQDFILEDIWEISRSPDKFLPRNAFLYTASFPCTDLSLAGDRAGLSGKQSGTLKAFLKIVEKQILLGCKPKIILLENVPGFISSNNGRDIIDTIRFFSDIGYTIDLLEIDASLFLPQSRKRLFLVAVDRTIVKKIENFSFYLDELKNDDFRSEKIKKIIYNNKDLNFGFFSVPSKKTNKNNISSILESLSLDSLNWWNEERKNKLFLQMNENNKMKLSNMIKKNYISYGTIFRRMRSGSSSAELRIDGIAGCLRTPRGGSSKQILLQAGQGSWNVRLLTPREYARLQGVRDDFTLPENTTKAYFAMGDAVCVPVIEYISKHVLIPAYKAFLLSKAI